MSLWLHMEMVQDLQSFSVMAHASVLIGALDSDSHFLTLCPFSVLVPHDYLCANVAHCYAAMGELILSIT